MANVVRFLLSADDKVTSTLGKVDDKFKRIGVSGVATGVAIGAGFAAVNLAASAALSAIEGFIGGSIAAYMEEERSQAKLRAALDSNIPAWDGYTGAIERTIKARMDLAYSDDEQRESLAVLVSQTKDATKALELQRTAMDLARLRGLSLADASLLIGKVYGGNIGILTRYGIQLKKGTTATEAIAEIQRRAAGQAEAYANTLEGKLTRAQIRLNEAQEDFGKAAAPAAAAGLDAMTDLVSGLGYLMDQETRNEVDWAYRRIKLQAKTDAELAALVEDAGAHRLMRNYAWAILLERQATDSSYDYVEAIRGGLQKVADVDVPAPDDEALEPAGNKAARAYVIGLQTGLRDGWSAVEDAAATLAGAMKNPMDRATRIAYLEGQLASANLAAGMRSSDPLVREAAYKYRDTILAELAKLRASTYTSGRNTGSAYGGGIAKGIYDSWPDIHQAMDWLARKIRAGSPPQDPANPLHRIDKWGFATGRSYLEAMGKGMRSSNPASALAGLAGSLAGTSGGVAARASGQPVVLNVSYNPGISTASPAEMDRAARTLGPAIVRELRARGLVPAGSY